MGNDSDSQAYVVLFKDRHVVVPVYAGAGLRDVLDGRGECGKKQREKSTYVALTSSFAGTGGMVEAMTSVACAGHNVVASACAKSVQYVMCRGVSAVGELRAMGSRRGCGCRVEVVW